MHGMISIQRTARVARWVPSLYMSMGFPYVFVASVATVMYRNLGMSAAEVAIFTSQLYIPWVLKPLWAPVLEAYGTTARWIVAMQVILMGAFALLAFALPVTHSNSLTLAIFWMMGFASATQDIAIDGLFMENTTHSEQARYAGIQNMCWNVGAVAASGLLVSLSGTLRDVYHWEWAYCWAFILSISAILMGVSALWHVRVLPSHPKPRAAQTDFSKVITSIAGSWRAFMTKPKIWAMLGVVFTYRLGEGFLEKLGPIFLLDEHSAGGMNLGNQTLGLLNGSLGTVAFVGGTLLAGAMISKVTLHRSFLLLAVGLNIPHLSYYILSLDPHASMPAIFAAVLLEKFGYGFGSVGHMLYMVQQVSPGAFRMSHYAYATSVMALCKWLTGWLCGPLFVTVNHDYNMFFLSVSIISIIPIYIAYVAPFSLPAPGVVTGKA